jgi:hypothetical protein
MKQILIKSGRVYFHRREWFLGLGVKERFCSKKVELSCEFKLGSLVFVKV